VAAHTRQQGKDFPMHVDGYQGRHLVAYEGRELGQKAHETVADCARYCDDTRGCQSFTFGISGADAGKCYLKDQVVTASSADTHVTWNGEQYRTYYKVNVKHFPMHIDGYQGRRLVAHEGHGLGDREHESLAACARYCDDTRGCRSFTFGILNEHVGQCYLKDEAVKASSEDTQSASAAEQFRTYYKVHRHHHSRSSSDGDSGYSGHGQGGGGDEYSDEGYRGNGGDGNGEYSDEGYRGNGGGGNYDGEDR